jgi:hypothetical protein
MTKRLGAVLASTILIGSIARAGEPAPPRSAIAVQLAREMLPYDNWQQAMKGYSAQMKLFLRQLQRDDKTVPEETTSDFVDEYLKMFSYQEMLDIEASVLAKYYTAAEMKELLAFYRTPLGRKSIRIAPELSQDVHGQTFALIQQRFPAFKIGVKAKADARAAESATCDSETEE